VILNLRPPYPQNIARSLVTEVVEARAVNDRHLLTEADGCRLVVARQDGRAGKNLRLASLGEGGKRDQKGQSDDDLRNDQRRQNGREQEVLAELRRGRTNKEIATRLNVSVSTVNKHVQQILKKLDVRSRTQAVAKIHAEASGRSYPAGERRR